MAACRGVMFTSRVANAQKTVNTMPAIDWNYVGKLLVPNYPNEKFSMRDSCWQRIIEIRG